MNRRELMLGSLAGLLSRSVSGRALVNTALDGSAGEPNAAPVPGDRWLEIDLYWFRLTDIAGSVKEFWDRFLALYEGVEGYCGVVLNVGWTVEYIMSWPGDLAQRIVLPDAGGQQPWVRETAPLKGDWNEQQLEWKQRFAQPIQVPRRGYGPWTYENLKTLTSALRSAAMDLGIRNFRVGSLALAWTAAYGTETSVYGNAATFLSRHPEAFTRAAEEAHFGQFFDPGNTLHKDAARMGGLPSGIPEGMPVHAVFAAQWGSLSKAVGLEALMLRDSFGMPVPYTRKGPYGLVAPSPEVARRYSASVAALVRETKLANSGALVMMYSNGASAIGDWRSNCCDLEAIAKEGYLDIFVDQTWAGAWNEVGVRNDDFWNSPDQGYTYQLAYLLIHAAILADTKVRHYPLIETFDAWESWDVLHTVPGRLRWEIWAYAHAGLKTPAGLKLPRGSYISWGNQGERLLSEEDVRFLSININQASVDARQTTEIFGPTLVYSREAMQWQMDHASPGNGIQEWIDEQAGSVMKWPIPILTATRLEWLPEVRSELFILQTPVHLSAKEESFIVQLIESGQPMALFGSTVGGISQKLEGLGGLAGVRDGDEAAKIHTAEVGSSAEDYVSNVPASFPTLCRPGVNRSDAKALVLYSVEGSPELTLNRSGRKRVVTWDAAVFKEDNAPHEPLVEAWGGSAAPYALAAGALNSLLSTPDVLHAKKIDMNQTVSICAWRRADGGLRLLAANLEEGIRNDSDSSRRAALVLPDDWKAAKLSDIWSNESLKVDNGCVLVELNQAQSRLLAIWR